MKPIPRLCCAILWLTPAILPLCGCTSTYVAQRAQQKPGVLESLDPATRERVLAGEVDQGWSKDMVTIAIGQPDHVAGKTTPQGAVEVWSYRNMPRPHGRHFRGLRFNSDAVSTAQVEALLRPSYSTHGYDLPGFSKADAAALDAAWELPDVPLGTLYVFFYNDRVFRLAMKR
ncbi:MAG: hypothetical protein ACHQ4G_11895 [Opitutales bacterium]